MLRQDTAAIPAAFSLPSLSRHTKRHGVVLLSRPRSPSREPAMPIARYFVFVGGALLALLLAVNWFFVDVPDGASTLPVEYSPLLPQAEDFNIRIHSDRKWPEKLMFDTNPRE
jgi:hypothetical protein